MTSGLTIQIILVELWFRRQKVLKANTREKTELMESEIVHTTTTSASSLPHSTSHTCITCTVTVHDHSCYVFVNN